MSPEALLEKFPRPAVAAKREGVTPQEYRKQQQEKLQAARQAAENQQSADVQQKMTAQAPGQPNDDAQQNETMTPGGSSRQGASNGSPQTMAPDELAEILLPGAKNIANQNGPGNRPGAPAMNFEQIQAPQRIIAELAMAKMDRAVYSEKQLYEEMVDFWFNHFNVFAGKGADRWLLTSYERDVIQPRTLGKFKDLLTATAKSPAMLFYLDNFLSADPRAADRLAAQRAARQWRRNGFGRPFPQRPAQQQGKKNVRGLNENYGRELMELHTLGVDGGYTQKDVTEVARCFTGWTIDKPREYADFKFDERLHDPDPKMVLGKKVHAGGMKDGEQVIELLARHPSTAKFISTKLARRFVSDTPPPSLLERMARTFQSSDGDIRAVLKTMIWSPEFWSRESYRAKIKTPFELVVSEVRALGTDVDTPLPLVQWVGRIGEPLYQCQPPTGYADNAEGWGNTGALLNRLNFSLTLAGNKVRGS